MTNLTEPSEDHAPPGGQNGVENHMEEAKMIADIVHGCNNASVITNGWHSEDDEDAHEPLKTPLKRKRIDSIDNNNKISFPEESDLSPLSQTISFDKHRRKTKKLEIARDK